MPPPSAASTIRELDEGERRDVAREYAVFFDRTTTAPRREMARAALQRMGVDVG